MNVFGFSLLRNGIKYDYPFRESLTSLNGLCNKIFLALGDSTDETPQALQKIPNIEIIPTLWDENLRKDGVILSQQTNIALNSLKESLTRTDPSGLGQSWGFYLQADEVLMESEYSLIQADLKKALEQGCDAVRFRYLHFWLSYDRFAIGKEWYPQEIRALRLDRPIESYGDAQSFRGTEKIYESDAHIFHYGHVREAQAYDLKKKDFHRWWHTDGELARVLKRGKKRDSAVETLRYLGPHPHCMKARIQKHQSHSNPALKNSSDLKVSFFQRILQPAFQTFQKKKFIPKSMRSPQARPWTSEFRTQVELWQSGQSTADKNPS